MGHISQVVGELAMNPGRQAVHSGEFISILMLPGGQSIHSRESLSAKLFFLCPGLQNNCVGNEVGTDVGVHVGVELGRNDGVVVGIEDGFVGF